MYNCGGSSIVLEGPARALKVPIACKYWPFGTPNITKVKYNVLSVEVSKKELIT